MKSRGAKILTSNVWNKHLSRQFNWTKKLRTIIYDKIDLKKQNKILDAGCGIGLIAKEMGEISGGEVYGVDINKKLLKIAEKNFPEGSFQQGSIEKLPFDDNTFDVAFCHFVLMWVKNPGAAIKELKRVTKPGGWIVCAAEPDYGGKIDYPDEYNTVAASIRTIQNEGGNPFFGRRLKAAFAANKLKPFMSVFTDLWDDETMEREFKHTWEIQDLTTYGALMKSWVQRVRQSDIEALNKGERVTLLPIFWGAARKPDAKSEGIESHITDIADEPEDSLEKDQSGGEDKIGGMTGRTDKA